MLCLTHLSELHLHIKYFAFFNLQWVQREVFAGSWGKFWITGQDSLYAMPDYNTYIGTLPY